MCATSHGEQIRGEALPSWLGWVPEMPFEKMAEYSIDFWLQSEDLPRPENRIYYDDGKVVLDITEGDEQAAKRLKHKLESLMEPIGARPHLLERKPVSGQGHPDQRHRPPGRHLPLRHRPEHVRSRPGLPRA